MDKGSNANTAGKQSASLSPHGYRLPGSTDASGAPYPILSGILGIAEAATAIGNPMELSVLIGSSNDVVEARREGRIMAARRGLSAAEATLVAAAISELARNIVDYAGHGEIHLSAVSHMGRHGITIVARDHGPGIADIKGAGQLGNIASEGMGLPGVRRIMDEFDIASGSRCGTTVTVTKWKRQ